MQNDLKSLDKIYSNGVKNVHHAITETGFKPPQVFSTAICPFSGVSAVHEPI